MGGFSTFFFSFLSKKWKTPPNLTKIRCIPDPNFFLNFIFGDGLVAEGNTAFFLGNTAFFLGLK